MKLLGMQLILNAAWLCAADTIMKLFLITIFHDLHTFCDDRVLYCMHCNFYCIFSV